MAGCPSVDLQGTVTVSDGALGGCNGCGVNGGTRILQLALACAGGVFECVQSTDLPCPINTPAPAFSTPPVVTGFSAIQLLILNSNAALTWRLNGVAATLTGVGGVFPTTFAGGETLIADVDGGVSVTTTFLAADQSAAQVAARINAAFALAGLPSPATVAGSGQLVLTGLLTGAEGTVNVTGGTAQVALGFPVSTNDSAVGTGVDIRASGLVVLEADRSNPYTKVEVQGTASAVTILAAGTSA